MAELFYYALNSGNQRVTLERAVVYGILWTLLIILLYYFFLKAVTNAFDPSAKTEFAFSASVKFKSELEKISEMYHASSRIRALCAARRFQHRGCEFLDCTRAKFPISTHHLRLGLELRTALTSLAEIDAPPLHGCCPLQQKLCCRFLGGGIVQSVENTSPSSNRNFTLE